MKRATSKAMVAGIGGTGALGAAAVALFGLSAGDILPKNPADDSTPSSLTSAAKTEEICLRTDAPFFEGTKAGCFGKDALAKWGEAHVLDNRGRAVTLSLAHPTDFTRAFETVRDCKTYRRLTKEGWYAASTREMRREAYFDRACGALVFLQAAAKADEGFFEEDALTLGDIKSLAEGPPFRFTQEPFETASLEPVQKGGAPQIAAPQKGIWNITAKSQQARLQELAYADFNADGVGDILVFVQISAVDATASVGQVGYLEKKSADSPVRFSR